VISSGVTRGVPGGAEPPHRPFKPHHQSFGPPTKLKLVLVTGLLNLLIWPGVSWFFAFLLAENLLISGADFYNFLLVSGADFYSFLLVSGADFYNFLLISGADSYNFLMISSDFEMFPKFRFYQYFESVKKTKRKNMTSLCCEKLRN
jgi:hypothetical protein